MNQPRHGVGLVRIRPTSSKNDGPDPKRLREAAAKLPGGERDVFVATSGFDENASDVAEIVSRLSNDLTQAAVGRQAVLIDLAFDLDGNARAEWLIGEALEIASPVLATLASVVLLFEELPQSKRVISRRIADNEILATRTIICNLTTSEARMPEHVGWDVDALIRVVHYDLADYAKVITSRLVRRRGVFQSPFEERFFGYWYSASNSAEEFAHLLGAYIDEKTATNVVYDDNSEDWFVHAVRDACGDGLAALSSSEILEESGQARLVEGPIVVVGPMLRTGTAFKRIYEALRSRKKDLRFFVIMADKNGIDRQGLYYITKAFPISTDGAVDIDYLVPVSHHVIEPPNWRLTMASWAMPSEIEDPFDVWSVPTATAMWDLIEALPLGNEDPTPRHRRAIRGFPQLKKLDPNDATWLAESFLRVASAEFNVERTLAIVVLPQEEPDGQLDARNGSRPLSEAFKKHLKVVTIGVRREDIDRMSEASDAIPPDYLVSAIEQHPGYEVIVVDESAVSFDSLERLSVMVTKANGGRPPVLSCAVIEAITPTYEPPPTFRSRVQWQPILAN